MILNNQQHNFFLKAKQNYTLRATKKSNFEFNTDFIIATSFHGGSYTVYIDILSFSCTNPEITLTQINTLLGLVCDFYQNSSHFVFLVRVSVKTRLNFVA